MRLHRTLGATAVALALAASLSGCLKIAGEVAIDRNGETARLGFSAGVPKESLKTVLEESETTLEITDENICEVLQEQLEGGSAATSQQWESDGDSCVTRSAEVAYTYGEDGSLVARGTEDVSSDGVSIRKLDDRTVQVSLDSFKLEETLSGEGSSMGDLTYELSVSYPEPGATGTGGARVSEDGKTVTWDDEAIRVAAGETDELQATGFIAPDYTVPVAVGLGALGLAVVAGGVLVVRSRAKGTSTEAEVAPESL